MYRVVTGRVHGRRFALAVNRVLLDRPCSRSLKASPANMARRHGCPKWRPFSRPCRRPVHTVREHG